MNRIIRWIDSSAPEADATAARQFAEQRFGIRATAHELYAERDRNFRLDSEDGRSYLLKLSNADTDPEEVAFQARALRHIASLAPELPVPKLIPDRHGRFILERKCGNADVHLVRMFGWLEGECVELAAAGATVRRQTGRCLASLGQALLGCDPAGAPRNLPWDIRCTPQFRDLTGFITDPTMLSLVHDRIDRFETDLLPALKGLRHQVIHNDFNPGNLLFAPTDPERISGVIDFGDMIEAPLIFDLAVACAYQLSGGPNPLSELLPMVTGYHSITPLQTAEFEVLLPLTECRLMTTYLIQGTRAAERADNDLELAGTSDRAGARLRVLAEVPHADGISFLAAACREITVVQNP